jgi:ankyrin repeat protein
MRDLLTCVSRGYIDEVERILIKGANTESMGKNGITPFLKACQTGDVKMMKLLKSYKANFRAVDRNDKGASEYVQESGNPKAVALVHSLLARPLKKPMKSKSQIYRISNRKSVNPHPRLPLLIQAARKGDVAWMGSLPQNGAEVDARDYRHRTALVHAVLEGQVESARFLLENGADVECPDSDRITMLHLALDKKKPDTELIKVLVEYGCDVNAPYRIESNTPLHLAVRYHADVEAIKLLIENGADVFRKDIFGRNAYQLLIEIGNQDEEAEKVFIDAFTKESYALWGMYKSSDLLDDNSEHSTSSGLPLENIIML